TTDPDWRVCLARVLAVPASITGAVGSLGIWLEILSHAEEMSPLANGEEIWPWIIALVAFLFAARLYAVAFEQEHMGFSRCLAAVSIALVLLVVLSKCSAGETDSPVSLQPQALFALRLNFWIALYLLLVSFLNIRQYWRDRKVTVRPVVE